MKLRYTRPALTDLDIILTYIAERSPQAVEHVRARLQIVIDLLQSHPLIGPQTEDPSIRRIVASPYPYLIFYEIAGDEIVIHAVRHGARNPTGMPGAGTGGA